MSTDSEILETSRETPGAFAELFERHARVVGAFAARRVGADAAEDILSETFLVAFRRRADFDATWASAKPWLLGIASRIIKKHHAQEAAQWRSIAASISRGEHTSDGAIEAAGGRVDASAAVRALAPRIAGLAARDRETLLLYARGDLTYEEIAVALGGPGWHGAFAPESGSPKARAAGIALCCPVDLDWNGGDRWTSWIACVIWRRMP